MSKGNGKAANLGSELLASVEAHVAEIVRDDTGEYPQAADFLKLMKSIERKVGSDAE